MNLPSKGLSFCLVGSLVLIRCSFAEDPSKHEDNKPNDVVGTIVNPTSVRPTPGSEDVKPHIRLDNLVGAWNSGASVASGWGDAFLFFDDGKYQLHYSQMDCEKRTVSEAGTWRRTGNELILTAAEKTVMKGGRLVDATGVCRTPKELVDATASVEPGKPATKRLAISKIALDPEARRVVTIDGRKFWWISWPQEYR
jgi:hypothetical protein